MRNWWILPKDNIKWYSEHDTNEFHVLEIYFIYFFIIAANYYSGRVAQITQYGPLGMTCKVTL